MSHRSLLRPTRLAQSTLALSLSALLTACGGGGEAPPPRAGDEVITESNDSASASQSEGPAPTAATEDTGTAESPVGTNETGIVAESPTPFVPDDGTAPSGDTTEEAAAPMPAEPDPFGSAPPPPEETTPPPLDTATPATEDAVTKEEPPPESPPAVGDPAPAEEPPPVFEAPAEDPPAAEDPPVAEAPPPAEEPLPADEPPAATPSTGHALNCADHPDALVCHTFTDQASVDAVWIDPGLDCIPDAVFDTTEQAGRLTIGTRCPANSAGDFRFDFPTQTGQLWMQFRYRASAGFIDEPALYSLPSAKVSILWSGSSSCTTHEFTQTNGYWRGFPQWYEACGAQGVEATEGSDFDYQPGGDTACWRHSLANGWEREGVPCLKYQDRWATYTYHLDYDGSAHGGTPWVEGWVHYDGDERVQVLSHRLVYVREANHLMLTPYMTAKNSTVDHPQWPLWYQDILVTTRPLIP